MEWSPLLLAESDGGIAWVIAVGGGIIGAAGALFGVLAKYDKDRMDYLFAQYKATVDRVRKEHEEDRVQLDKTEAGYMLCREENAQLKERIVGLEREIAEMKGKRQKGNA